MIKQNMAVYNIGYSSLTRCQTERVCVQHRKQFTLVALTVCLLCVFVGVHVEMCIWFPEL